MTRLDWNALGTRFFETGVDRGVLFIAGRAGVPWNGLVSVSESSTGGEPKPYYLDGVKYLNRPKPTEFKGVLTAFSSPQEFDAVDGSFEVYKGLIATNQRRKSFGLSYRTLLGNDLLGHSYGYKIHILYNIMAEPADEDNQSLTESAAAKTLSWNLTATPVVVGPTYKPTAHFVIDSTRVSAELLKTLEDTLYGAAMSASRLPTLTELTAMFASYESFRVTLLPNGHYSAEGSAVIDNHNGSFSMDDPTVTTSGNAIMIE
jgi:hypothetical protein